MTFPLIPETAAVNVEAELAYERSDPKRPSWLDDLTDRLDEGLI